VLSGCRTGLGKEYRGEGIVGLSQAFLYAGASRVMVSLWAVQDKSTSILMADVYKGMLGPKKLRPSAALREAQLKMMKNPRWASPYYWAAFTMQGEPR
jgi:CHAT domain-containing protein